MMARVIDRRKLVTWGALALLSGCSVIPKAQRRPPPPPPAAAPAGPDVLPQDTERHRVALLVPLSGANTAVGQSLANAAAMALLDTNAANLRVTSYDTAAGPAAAASKAVADGNELILGPLLAEEIPAVAAVARGARVPVIAFSNDANAVSRDVFIMGSLPSQSVERTLGYAASQGLKTFAALAPRGEYGQRASAAMMDAAKRAGGDVLAMEPYDRSNASVASAAQRLHDTGGTDAVMILDGGRIAARVAPILKPAGAQTPRLLGTELWSGDAAVNATPALRGAWFSALSDGRFRQFATSYKARFGAQPYRLATMGYDAVLLSLRIARDWRPGQPFPTARLLDRGGFIGLDGPFRFDRSGVIERAFEVREVRAGGVTVVSPAPTRFAD